MYAHGRENDLGADALCKGIKQNCRFPRKELRRAKPISSFAILTRDLDQSVGEMLLFTIVLMCELC